MLTKIHYFYKLTKRSVLNKGARSRHEILQKAFELSYRKGYQATSVEDIIGQTSLSKSSFFYHFKNKEEMGLAMIKEIMVPGMTKAFFDPLFQSDHTTTALYHMFEVLLTQDPFFDPKHGCPAVNLIEEMAPLNPRFGAALSKLINKTMGAIEQVVQKGLDKEEIRPGIIPGQVSTFLISGYMGIRALGKIHGIASYEYFLKDLKVYLNTLT